MHGAQRDRVHAPPTGSASSRCSSTTSPTRADARQQRQCGSPAPPLDPLELGACDALGGARRRRRSRPRCGSSCARDDAELLAVRPAGHAAARAAARTRPGSSTTRSWRRPSERARRDRADDLEPDDEDVHSAIERLLGDVGRKIHAGRSRNDQVAAAFRLYVADACAEADAALGDVRARGARPRRGRGETPMPGYTHLQRAIPVTVGHHLLAWVEMLERDRARFAFARGAGDAVAARRRARSPARRCRCRRRRTRCATRSTRSPTATSRSTTSTRRAVLFVAPVADRRGARALDDAPSSGSRACRRTLRPGSSMMPQKLNPDVAELARGKAGTAIGRLTGLLATVKGAAARLRPRPAGGQAAGVRRAARRRRRARRR